MVRRVFSILSVIGMVLALSRVVDVFTPQQLQSIAGVFFPVLVGLQLWPLVNTQRNSYGPGATLSIACTPFWAASGWWERCCLWWCFTSIRRFGW